MRMPTRVVIVASGGRGHALAWNLAQELSKDRLFVAAGNPGIEHRADHLYALLPIL